MTDYVGIGTPQKIHFTEPLLLKEGRSLPEFDLMIETYGILSSQADNAVLICPALSGHHHVAGKYRKEDPYPGWWDHMIGPGKPIDTEKFFVVGINNLGGCHGSSGPLSLNPRTRKTYGADFPLVQVEDWVHSQAMLADYLKINTWAAVVGGSLGGMQVLQWTISYPQRLKHAVMIASAAKLSAQNIAFNDVARQAILFDSDFYDGFYERHSARPQKGLAIARMMGHITYLAEQGLGARFGRGEGKQVPKKLYDSKFQVESYLRAQGKKFASYFDANTYLLMTKALDYFDPAQGGPLDVALANICAKVLLISFSSDWRFAPQCSREIWAALIRAQKEVQYLEIESSRGHDAFLLDDALYLKGMRLYFEDIVYQALQDEREKISHVAC